MPTHPELAFLNSLSAKLKIELTKPTKLISPNLLNKRAPAEAKIASLHLETEVSEDDGFRKITPEELASVAFRDARIELRGQGGDGPAVAVVHEAPNGEFFTVQDLLAAIEETERQSRGSSEWFGGIDVHHIYFEGLALEEGGAWAIRWGS